MNNDNRNEQVEGSAEQEFEQALTRSLRRIDAPEGFAARVRALAEAEERTADVTRTSAAKRSWRNLWSLGWKPAWGAMAAIAVAGVLSGHAVHERRIEQERAQASRQFDVSVQITDKALDHAREQMRRAGVPLDADQ